jgi:hypothetical protein
MAAAARLFPTDSGTSPRRALNPQGWHVTPGRGAISSARLPAWTVPPHSGCARANLLRPLRPRRSLRRSAVERGACPTASGSRADGGGAGGTRALAGCPTREVRLRAGKLCSRRSLAATSAQRWVVCTRAHLSPWQRHPASIGGAGAITIVSGEPGASGSQPLRSPSRIHPRTCAGVTGTDGSKLSQLSTRGSPVSTTSRCPPASCCVIATTRPSRPSICW